MTDPRIKTQGQEAGDEMSEECKWAFYKGLWHKECCSYLTTTLCCTVVYTELEKPMNGICPECRGRIVETQRRFGRGKGTKND